MRPSCARAREANSLARYSLAIRHRGQERRGPSRIGTADRDHVAAALEAAPRPRVSAPRGGCALRQPRKRRGAVVSAAACGQTHPRPGATRVEPSTCSTRYLRQRYALLQYVVRDDVSARVDVGPVRSSEAQRSCHPLRLARHQPLLLLVVVAGNRVGATTTRRSSAR